MACLLKNGDAGEKDPVLLDLGWPDSLLVDCSFFARLIINQPMRKRYCHWWMRSFFDFTDLYSQLRFTGMLSISKLICKEFCWQQSCDQLPVLRGEQSLHCDDQDCFDIRSIPLLNIPDNSAPKAYLPNSVSEKWQQRTMASGA